MRTASYFLSIIVACATVIILSCATVLIIYFFQPDLSGHKEDPGQQASPERTDIEKERLVIHPPALKPETIAAPPAVVEEVAQKPTPPEPRPPDVVKETIRSTRAALANAHTWDADQLAKYLRENFGVEPGENEKVLLTRELQIYQARRRQILLETSKQNQGMLDMLDEAGEFVELPRGVEYRPEKKPEKGTIGATRVKGSTARHYTLSPEMFPGLSSLPLKTDQALEDFVRASLEVCTE